MVLGADHHRLQYDRIEYGGLPVDLAVEAAGGAWSAEGLERWPTPASHAHTRAGVVRNRGLHPQLGRCPAQSVLHWQQVCACVDVPGGWIQVDEVRPCCALTFSGTGLN